ncbi:MAG: hypothetical protein IIW08_03810 [Clostridia bacterium]|nr:hypothetical protein [Clostridia bacterium]
MEVTKKTIIGDVLDYNPETAQFFIETFLHISGGVNCGLKNPWKFLLKPPTFSVYCASKKKR